MSLGHCSAARPAGRQTAPQPSKDVPEATALKEQFSTEKRWHKKLLQGRFTGQYCLLCEMLYTEPQAITTVPAQRTHEAAREGFVPLCEDSLWNPRESLESPHSGLVKQPTKEGPTDIPKGKLFAA